MGKSVHLLFMFIFILNTTACSIGTPYQQPAVHDLGPIVTEREIGAPDWSVSHIDAPVWLWDEQIRYRLLYANPTQVRFYTRDRWVAPPPALLPQIMPKPIAQPGYQLRIQILNFEQLFDQPGQARVILNADVKAVHAATGKSLAEKRFQLQQSAVQANAQGAISGLVSLSHELVKRLDQWLRELPSN